ncbi:hypothetical protein VP01_7816g1, partial [Puccinia sorghi]
VVSAIGCEDIGDFKLGDALDEQDVAVAVLESRDPYGSDSPSYEEAMKSPEAPTHQRTRNNCYVLVWKDDNQVGRRCEFPCGHSNSKKGTRPDISFATHYLARFSFNPDQTHWAALRRLIAYVQSTQHFELKIERDNSPDPLKVYVDASWMGERAQSHQGFMATL